jgi:hypothetical protein
LRLAGFADIRIETRVVAGKIQAHVIVAAG